MDNTHQAAIHLHSFRETTCQSCSLRSLCLPISLDFDDMGRLDAIITRGRPLKRGETLFNQGDAFKAIYALRSGCVKTFCVTNEGLEQVTGFYLPSELVGLSGIAGGSYPVSAVAIETTTVCELPYDKFETLSDQIPDLKRQLIQSLSKEIREDQQMMLLLSQKNAEERVANFLMDLSARIQRRGYDPKFVHLPMSRNEIANHLGLAVETVSRIFSRLQKNSVINAKGRNVEILDSSTLSELTGKCLYSQLKASDS